MKIVTEKKKSERKNVIKSRKYVLKYRVCVNLLKSISQKYNGEPYYDKLG